MIDCNTPNDTAGRNDSSSVADDVRDDALCISDDGDLYDIYEEDVELQPSIPSLPEPRMDNERIPPPKAPAKATNFRILCIPSSVQSSEQSAEEVSQRETVLWPSTTQLAVDSSQTMQTGRSQRRTNTEEPSSSSPEQRVARSIDVRSRFLSGCSYYSPSSPLCSDSDAEDAPLSTGYVPQTSSNESTLQNRDSARQRDRRPTGVASSRTRGEDGVVHVATTSGQDRRPKRCRDRRPSTEPDCPKKRSKTDYGTRRAVSILNTGRSYEYVHVAPERTTRTMGPDVLLAAYHDYRDYVMDLISIGSNRLVFLNAAIEDGRVCTGFALASANNMYEGVGIAYDLALQQNAITSLARRIGTKRLYPRGSRIDPQEITKFLVAHVDFPVLVAIDYEHLLPLDGYTVGLLNRLCHLNKLTAGSTCCCSLCSDRACYVSASTKTPYCHRHAKVHDGTLQLYLPVFVSVRPHRKHIRMSILTYDAEESNPLATAQFTPLAYRPIKDSTVTRGQRRYNTTSERLMNIAYHERLEWRSGDYDNPLNRAKTLQNLCVLNPYDWKRGN